jgi:hypothetical protein
VAALDMREIGKFASVFAVPLPAGPNGVPVRAVARYGPRRGEPREGVPQCQCHPRVRGVHRLLAKLSEPADPAESLAATHSR